MKAIVQGLFGLVFGAVCLWLALRIVGTLDLSQAIDAVQPWWIVVALALYTIDVALRVKRWQLLLHDTLPLTYGQVAKALIIGYMVNNLLPARLGEIYRADFVKRHYGGSRSSTLGSIVVERLLDGIAVVLSLSVGLLILFLNRGIDSSILTTLAIVAASGCSVALMVVVWFHRAERIFNRIPWQWLVLRLREFGSTFQAVRTPGFRYPVALTGTIYTVEALVIWSALNAAAIDVGLAGALVVLGTGVLSTLLPTAPGYVGNLQVAYIFALAPFGYEASSAFVAATISQIFLSGITVVCGLLIMLSMGARKMVIWRVS